jgi:hypothetical protein
MPAARGQSRNSAKSQPASGPGILGVLIGRKGRNIPEPRANEGHRPEGPCVEMRSHLDRYLPQGLLRHSPKETQRRVAQTCMLTPKATMQDQ